MAGLVGRASIVGNAPWGLRLERQKFSMLRRQRDLKGALFPHIAQPTWLNLSIPPFVAPRPRCGLVPHPQSRCRPRPRRHRSFQCRESRLANQTTWFKFLPGWQPSTADSLLRLSSGHCPHAGSSASRRDTRERPSASFHTLPQGGPCHASCGPRLELRVSLLGSAGPLA